MKILELTNFSAGACGVFTRVFQESIELKKKGHEVLILSSNAIKGSNELAPEHEIREDIKIKRFPFSRLGGESYMSWDFEQAALEFKPDIIIAHSYRHPHTKKALKIAKQLDIKCFLVTHAPFIEDNKTRSFFDGLAVNFYDKFIGKKIINQFTKIIAITHWEMPYLEKLGAKKDKIVYIPNGISKEFFIQRTAPEQDKILFFGRISPVKNIENLINALALIKNKIKLEIVGPAEIDYMVSLKYIVKEKNLEESITFADAIYNIKDKITKIDSAKIFILPSKSEAMPQALIEAMARGKLVIASRTNGAKEIIKDNETGLLFDIDSEHELAQLIDFSLDANNKLKIKNIKEHAKEHAKAYSWDNLSQLLEDTIMSN